MRKTKTEKCLELLQRYQNELGEAVDKMPDELVCEVLDTMWILGEAMDLLRARITLTEHMRASRQSAGLSDLGPRTPLW